MYNYTDNALQQEINYSTFMIQIYVSNTEINFFANTRLANWCVGKCDNAMSHVLQSDYQLHNFFVFVTVQMYLLFI